MARSGRTCPANGGRDRSRPYSGQRLAQREQHVGGDGHLLALDPLRRQRLHDRASAEAAERGLADEDRADRRLGLEAGGDVHDVPDDGVLAVAARSAEHAGVDLAAVHADAEPRPVLVVLRDAGGCPLQKERGPRRARRVVGRLPFLVVDHHQLVAHDLVHLASARLHERDEPLEVRVQHGRDLARVVALRVGGEAAEVGEHDAHVLRACERLVEVERAEPLLVPLGARDLADHDERAEHEHVPLPPGDLPVARPRDHDHRLGEEREGEDEREQEP